MPLQLSASLNLTGSFNLSGSMSATQTLNITSSNSVNSITASYITSSNVVGTVTSASYALSSSFAPTNITASWSSNSLSASYLTTTNNYTVNNITSNATGSFGNVGIGTTNPGALLNVVGLNSIPHTILRNTTASTYTGLSIYNDQNNSLRALEIDYAGSSYSGSLVTSGSTGESAVIKTTGAYPLTFATNNTARITITSGGAIGIGTNNPSSPLNVVSTANSIIRLKGGSALNLGSAYYIEKAANTSLLTAYGDVASILGGATDQSVAVWTDTSIPYLFYIGGSEKMRIASGGNIGIGTTNPSYLLDINGDARIGTDGTAYGRLTVTKPTSGTTLNVSYASASSGYGEILMTNYSDPTGTTGYASYIRSYSDPITDYSSTLTFGTSTLTTNAPIERMRIANNGNVGIGTTNPIQKFDIRGIQLLNSSGSTDAATSASLMLTGQNTKGGSQYHDFLFVSNTLTGAVNPNKHFRLNDTGNFEIINSNYGTNIFTLTDSGSLTLATAQAGNVTQLRNTGAGLKVGNYGHFFDDGNVHIHSTSPGNNLWLNCSGSGMFVINGQTGATGGVCIGTSVQKGFVTIVGSVNAAITQPYGYLISGGAGSTTGTSPNPYSLTCDNRVMSSEFNVPSDERLKDIKGEISLNKAIDFITKIDPIEFTWKDGVDTGLKAGFSAQQTYKAGFEHLLGVVNRPGLERRTDEDGFVSPQDAQFVMNYEQVTPYHSKVIKHLLYTIEKLESKISNLESIIQNLSK